jgi:hypothetical protein
MLEIERWLKWQPSPKKFEDFAGCEPPKPPISTFEGFEGPIPGKTQNFAGPAANVQDTQATHFDRWVAECCVRFDRLFSPVGHLQIDFSEWLAKQGQKHCARPEFESLLTGAGYLLADGLASGLMLYADLHGDIYERLERLAIQAKSGVNK